MDNNHINDSIKQIKHNFMAYRNGIVSDTLRKAGMPYNIIFGLQLPQIAAIAREYGASDELADSLWKDSGVRESRLLACYLHDTGKSLKHCIHSSDSGRGRHPLLPPAPPSPLCRITFNQIAILRIASYFLLRQSPATQS